MFAAGKVVGKLMGTVVSGSAVPSVSSKLPTAALPGGAAGLLQVPVRNNNVDFAAKRLKRKLIENGVIREVRARRHYSKPSEERVVYEKRLRNRIEGRNTRQLIKYILYKKSRGF